MLSFVFGLTEFSTWEGWHQLHWVKSWVHRLFLKVAIKSVLFSLSLAQQVFGWLKGAVWTVDWVILRQDHALNNACTCMAINRVSHEQTQGHVRLWSHLDTTMDGRCWLYEGNTTETFYRWRCLVYFQTSKCELQLRLTLAPFVNFTDRKSVV